MSKEVEILHLLPQKKEVEIVIGEGLWKTELIEACRAQKVSRIAIIADESIASTYGKELESRLDALLLPFSGGERSKTRVSKEKFEDELMRQKLGRDTLLIGLGGGVVTDFTAFLASTYMRGVPLILVPTTLLAMVDAAIGGKTGLDTPYGKNLIGSLYHPSHIFIDPSLLSSLPDQEWTYGLAEILKYGLIADPSIWELLEKNPLEWKKFLHSLLLSSIRVKKRIVEEDPMETLGPRRILNFGHTIGHALEILSDFKMAHGEAVAIGCLVESDLSHRMGLLGQQDLSRIKTLFRKFPFSFKLASSFSFPRIFEAMKIDKKAKKEEPRFVLIDQIGHAASFDGEYCRAVPPSLLKETIECLNT